ncbi:MAG: hypothetical protein QF464_21110, partial [Myxococcota bacterium]|nr:hypothetical protein [Myxococcota bacterium]
MCFALLAGCSDTTTSAPTSDAIDVEDVATRGDGSGGDALASGDGTTSDADAEPVDMTLYGGAASRPLRLPIGTATVGYSPRQGPKTPYAISYPGTTAAHTVLSAKALVLRRGDSALALVRTDSIGIWQDMVRDAQVRLRELGHDTLADGLVVAATHTHKSGGRIFDHFVGEIAVGPFLEGFYPRFRDAI